MPNLALHTHPKKSMPTRPVRWRVLLPRRSISGIVTTAIVTMIAPTPSVAYGA